MNTVSDICEALQSSKDQNMVHQAVVATTPTLCPTILSTHTLLLSDVGYDSIKSSIACSFSFFIGMLIKAWQRLIAVTN